jgi:hypothetical protein
MAVSGYTSSWTHWLSTYKNRPQVNLLFVESRLFHGPSLSEGAIFSGFDWSENRPAGHFRRQYNEIRPHSSLGQLTPVEFKQKLSSTNNPELAIS